MDSPLFPGEFLPAAGLFVKGLPLNFDRRRNIGGSCSLDPGLPLKNCGQFFPGGTRVSRSLGNNPAGDILEYQ